MAINKPKILNTTIDLRKVKLSEVNNLIDVGKIRHSLVICAFKFFDSYSK